MNLIKHFLEDGTDIGCYMKEININNGEYILHLAENSRGKDYAVRWFLNGDQVSESAIREIICK